MRVYKYNISPSNFGELVKIDMPFGATVLTADKDSREDTAAIWALVNPEAPMMPRVFTVVGTGWDMPPAAEDFKYIGLVRIGEYIFHVFEV